MKFRNPFAKPTAVQFAKAELEEAHLHLLGYLSQAEFAANMARYYRDKIERLTQYTQDTPCISTSSSSTTSA